MNTQNGVEESFKNDFHFTTISTNSLLCFKWLKLIMGSESSARAQKVNIGCTIFFFFFLISKTHQTTFHLLGCGISTYKRSLSSQKLKYWEPTVDSSPLVITSSTPLGTSMLYAAGLFFQSDNLSHPGPRWIKSFTLDELTQGSVGYFQPRIRALLTHLFVPIHQV